MRIQRILARFRTDPVLSLASPKDFLRLPGRRIDSLEFHRLRPTPYCIDHLRRRVLFVVTRDPTVLVDVDFFNQGQFERATHAIVVPFDQMADLTLDLPVVDRPILLYNTGRCGSTAVVRLLNFVGDTLALSEPDLFAGVIGGDTNDPSLSMALDGSVRLLLRALGADSRRVVFKLRGFGALPDPIVRRSFSDARRMFLYRDGMETVVSGMRNFHGRRSLLVFFERLSRHALGRRLMRWMLSMGRGRGATLSPYMADVDLGLLSRAGGAGLLAVNWVSALQGVRSIRDTDRQMPAILYADLLSQPRRIVEKMVGHADLIASDDELDRAARMVTERRDPHVGGRLDPSRQRKWNPTPGIDEAIRQILAAVPDSR